MAQTLDMVPTGTYTFQIVLFAEPSGVPEAISAGDVFTPVSSSPAVGVAFVPDANGLPQLVVIALTQPDANTATGITVTVNDSDGDVAFVLNVNYPVPPQPGEITLGTVVVGTQAPPSAPGP